MNTKILNKNDIESFTVEEFCKSQKISIALFYKMKKNDLMPKIMKIGRATRITREAILEWQKKLERQ